MHRKLLLNQLANYKKRYVDESDKINAFIQFIETHENCFERQLSIGHITASTWLIDPTALKVLLTHHKKLNKWLQLGGHADGNTNPITVAIQEAQEESGLNKITPINNEIFDIDIHQIPAIKNKPSHLHYDVRFLLKATTTEPLIVSQTESHDLAWVNINSLTNYTQEESILRMQRKWLNFKN